MVAPSLALNLITPTFTGYPQANVITDLPGVGNYSANNSQLQFNCSATAGQTYFIELIFSAGAIDATDTLWCAHFQTNFSTNTGRIGLGSGAGNYQYWQGTNNTGYGNSFRTLELIFDTRRPPIDTAVGSFNIAAVDRIRFEFQSGSTITNAVGPIFYAIPFYWAASDGMRFVGGDASNPLGFADLFDLRIPFISNRQPPFQVTYFNNFIGTDNVQLAIPVVEGDSTTTHLAPNGFLLFTLREINSTFANFVDTNLVESSYKARFTGLTVLSRTFQKNDLPYSWADEGGNNTWRRLNIAGATTVNLGTSNYTNSSIDAATGLVQGANSVAISFSDCTAPTVYRWTGANLANSSFDCPLADHYIELVPASYPATFDASNIDFLSNPTGEIFLCNVPSGQELTIQVSASSGLTNADVLNIGSGTVAVESPPITISAVGFPAGSTVILSQGGIGLDLLNSATSPYTYEVGSQGESGTNYQFKIISPGKEDFIATINTADNVFSVPYLGLDAGSEQTVDQAYLDFCELMRADTAFQALTAGDQTLNMLLWEIPEWRQGQWNPAIIANPPSTGDVAQWIGYLTSTGYNKIAFVAVTGDGRVAGEVN